MINSTHIPVPKQLWENITFIVEMADESTKENEKYSEPDMVNIEYILMDRLMELFEKLKNNLPEIYVKTLEKEIEESNRIKNCNQ
ncbi:MAG: hypothetical protein IJO11_01750 [Alphaproteobacteria bacterium]|nr:hypothetical protein [Alphaproteobacteria bacterium]